MAVLLWVPLLLAAGTAVVVVLWPRPVLVDWSGAWLSAAILATAAILAVGSTDGRVPTSAGGMLRADALSSYMLVVVGCVALTATWGGVARRGGGGHEPRYAALVALFLGAMSLAVLADNLGVVWVAIEATTIATAFLVGHHRTRLSLEAAWKYVVLGSVGVAIAFLGIVLLYAASLDAGNPTLSWIELVELAPQMDTRVAEVAVALGVLGFATKAGLAPMHSWLPDAHSQAPAPVSGLMSGVLLSVALYVILRLQVVADLAIGPGLIRWMLSVGGVASLLVASLLLLRQRDYKRMLAYSSIEHMGIMAVGAAAGGSLGMTAVLVHMLGHGLVKSSLFVVAGRVLAVEGTTAIGDVRGLLVRRPGLGRPFVVGMAALLGFPPFVLFFTEVAVVVALWSAGMPVVAALVLLLLLVAFTALGRLTASMTLGAGVTPEDTTPVDPAGHGPRAPVVLALTAAGLMAALVLPLGTFVGAAARVLTGGA